VSRPFKNKGGVSETDPNPVVRWLISKVLSWLYSPKRLQLKHNKAEAIRKKSGASHKVEYFHQVTDGYSYLAAQVLQSLSERYDIELVCHLVNDPEGDNSPEPELLQQLSCYDAYHVAPEYGLEFPECQTLLKPELVSKASAILAAQNNQSFIAFAAEIGKALWTGNEAELDRLANEYGSLSKLATEHKLQVGSQRRAELKHYSGAMFFYGNEWYWGVDRLYHLEKRLAALGADKMPGLPLLVERPHIEIAQLKDSGSLTLEVYPSLRSPYSAISFDRAVKLARDTGVKLVVRPVLPMVMRGVPATREKGLYIFMDAAREAYAANIPYGKFSDPIGEPVRNAYSLYPWAQEQGKDVEFISSFLSCAFAKGINTNKESGLKSVVEGAGLDWNIAKAIVGQSGWEDKLEQNRLAMYHAGLWGVPSFRLLDKNNHQILALWGQDRLWLIAKEIERQISRA